jgi:hypothetical protein
MAARKFHQPAEEEMIASIMALPRGAPGAARCQVPRNPATAAS